MKSEIKRFEDGAKRLVYNGNTKVAKVWADNMADARTYLLKCMDGGSLGVITGVAVTLAYAPVVTFIIRGKELFPFIQSPMTERESYRRTPAYAALSAQKGSGSFTKMVESQEKPTSEVWDQLVIYCPGTQRFLFDITKGSSGFPIALVTDGNPQETAITRLSDVSGSVVTVKHVKPFNEVSADGVKHHFFFMVCKHEFIPKNMTMKWAPHKIESKNYITKLMFERDPTLLEIVESETKPQKMDFSKIVDDMMD